MTGTPGAATSLQDLRYGDLSPEASWYDAVGNILTIKDYKAGGTQTQSFSYDNADRLLSAAASGGTGGIYSETYTYNGTTGNLSSKAGINYTYLDDAHRHAVTHLNGVQKYWYDANGNMVSRIVGGQTYTLWYDPENRLVGVSGAATATFTYDGDGKRVKATVGGTTTVYIGNYTEWTGSASTMVKYIYAGGQPVAMRVGAGTTRYFLLSDHLGSTTVTANSSGAFYSELRYKAWGEIRYSSGTTPTTLRYTGQRQESSLCGADGLYYYGARWLDPALGRWIQPDSLIPDLGNPIDLDRFAYARNNPVKYFDPSGHISCEKLGTEECDENGDYVDDQPPPVGQSAYPTRDSATPFEVGKEWLSGSGQRRHVFIDVDPFTELLRQHEHIQNVRELILQRKVALICSKSGIEAYKIPEKLLILNVKHALQDDSCIAFGGSHTRFRTFVLDIAL